MKDEKQKQASCGDSKCSICDYKEQIFFLRRYVQYTLHEYAIA